MKKEQIQKIVLFSLFGIGLIYSYITYLFSPEWTKIKNQEARLFERQNYYQSLLSNQGNLNGLQNEIQAAENQLKQSNLQFPNLLDKPQIMAYLYSLAKQHAVSPQSLKFEQAQNKGYYQEISLSFICQGKTADVLSLLQDIQKSTSQRFTTQGVNLSVQQGVMRGEMKLTAYAVTQSGTDVSATKPSYMNTPFGIGNILNMFQ